MGILVTQLIAGIHFEPKVERKGISRSQSLRRCSFQPKDQIWAVWWAKSRPNRLKNRALIGTGDPQLGARDGIA